MEPAAVGAVACVAAGRVSDIAARLQEEAFYSRCAARYRAAGFGTLGAAEERSWRNSWPPLFEALVRAGLEDLQVYLEYGTPGGGRRLDALLVGAAPGGVLGLVIVELKQWQACRVLDSDRVMRSDGLVTAHPVHQVAAYRSFFQHWRPGGAPELDVRGVVVLHNATAGEGAELAAGAGEDAGIRVLTAEDLSGPAHVLAERLQCRDLVAPDAGQVAAFEDIRWQPSSRLLDHVGADLVGHRSFALVGDQQDAFVRIRAAASHYLTAFDAVTAQRPDRQSSNGSGAIVTVSGGPGSGKTALAVRLLGYLMRQHPNAAPRFITPSGTLRAHLLDATSGHMAARELFPSAGILRSIARQAGVLVIDEAQRLKRGAARGVPADLAAVLEQVPLAVIFLDERQIIRPDEGTTVEEIRTAARALGHTHHHLELTGSFRCSGSAAYTAWVDALLYGTPTPWTGHIGYDLRLADEPFQLQEWIEHATAQGHTARTSAGFCWPWTRTRPPGASTLPLDITIGVSTTQPGVPARTWHAAWNAATALTHPSDGRPLAPHSQLWASHTGGHQQIGCIYTAQGLEYHHAGVIIGPDLTWRNGEWTARPQESCDDALRHLTPQQYLPYALNTYRVLLTRGTHSTRIYATDTATHQLLQSLIHPNHHTPVTTRLSGERNVVDRPTSVSTAREVRA
ncbi:DNA/RNA helicase domain-containing protein [Streptomyces longwoodensis]|uniref:DNA/RNA helicase domain-containing protein n=1 Tax=Streptomyces longwoodensis TaxID=68231 RepID=UPI0033C08D27